MSYYVIMYFMSVYVFACSLLSNKNSQISIKSLNNLQLTFCVPYYEYCSITFSNSLRIPVQLLKVPFHDRIEPTTHLCMYSRHLLSPNKVSVYSKVNVPSSYHIVIPSIFLLLSTVRIKTPVLLLCIAQIYHTTTPK